MQEEGGPGGGDQRQHSVGTKAGKGGQWRFRGGDGSAAALHGRGGVSGGSGVGTDQQQHCMVEGGSVVETAARHGVGQVQVRGGGGQEGDDPGLSTYGSRLEHIWIQV